jgi:shikimate kinase
MLNICANCGQYRPDKIIDPVGPVAICPECGYRHPFRQLPLFVVAGASGAGKSTVCRRLMQTQTLAVALDDDILWRAEFDTPANGYRDFFETWLRLAANISQAGRPVLLFGGGIGLPANLEPCVYRRYFSVVHYLALVCDDEALTERLTRRPAWRQSAAAEFLTSQHRFNQWFKAYRETQPAMTRVDTTRVDEATTARQVLDWVNAGLA